MAPSSKTLFVVGSFAELASQMAQFIDSVSGAESKIQPEIDSIAESKPEEALQKIVGASAAIKKAAETDIIPSYNLLAHLVQQSESPSSHFSVIFRDLAEPIPSPNGASIALSVLGSIFNLIPSDDKSRHDAFVATVQLASATGSFELVKAQLKQLPTWLAEWKLDAKAERALYLSVYEAAKEAEDADAFNYLLSALRTFTRENASDDEARALAVRTSKVALASPSVYDFNDLIDLPATQALRSDEPVLFELLGIFAGENREEFDALLADNPDWLEKQELNVDVLTKKINLLTLASLAASVGQTRALPYESIVSSLKVPEEEVEMWVIDVIRAGLVEGKLSQSDKMFLIHRTTYRVFGDKQWQEVASRLDVWRSSLTNVLTVIRAERENLANSVDQAENETRGGNQHGNRRQDGNRGPRRDNRHKGQNQGQQQEVKADA